METAEYEIMFRCEDAHWWYWGLRDLLLPWTFDSTRGKPDVLLLDAGCGTGKHLEMLAHAGFRCLGLDRSETALAFSRRRNLEGVARGSVSRLPFPSGLFDLVVSTDVICCLEAPEGDAAFHELARVLRPGGTLLLNLPAYEWLRSRHDEAVHTRRRFTRAALSSVMETAGLEVELATYRNTLLFPCAAAVRLIRGRGGPRSTSDLAPLPSALNTLLKLPLALENRWIRAGGRLPFGLSLFVVARKSAASRNGEPGGSQPRGRLP